MRKRTTSLTVLLSAFAGAIAWGYQHPTDCTFANSIDLYSVGYPNYSASGPNSTFVVNGAGGAPHANASCWNLETPPPSSASATGSRRDGISHLTSGVGVWHVTYYVQDTFFQRVGGEADWEPTDVAWALSRSWIKDIPSGTTMEVPLERTWFEGASYTVTQTNTLTLNGVVTVGFGDGGASPIEGETMSVAGATSTDKANAVGDCDSGPSPIVIIVTGASDIG